MTAQQILSLAGTVSTMVETGKLALDEVLVFLESKGADPAQIAANRALLVADITSLEGEIRADETTA